GDAVAGVERDSTSEKADHGPPALIWEDLGIGQASAVVNRDVYALPACGLTPDAKGVLASWPFATGGRPGDPAAGAALDPSQPLDVDVDQLTRPLALVADRWLKAEASELAHSDPVQDPRDSRERHVEHLGDLRTGEPQPSERRDRLDPLLTGPVRNPMRRRGAIPQPALPLSAVADHPFARAADTDSGGLGRLRQRPLPLNDGTAELAAAFETERSVSVQVHPVSSLVGLRWLGSSQPPRRPGWTNLLRNYTYAVRNSAQLHASPAFAEPRGCANGLPTRSPRSADRPRRRPVTRPAAGPTIAFGRPPAPGHSSLRRRSDHAGRR